MARNQVQNETGFVFNYTDLNKQVFTPEDDCITDALGFADLDGDGVVDFVCIGTESGNYEDTDHEVVAIHSPSGQAMWRTSVKYTSLNSASPVIWKSGRTSTPGASMSTMK